MSAALKRGGRPGAYSRQEGAHGHSRGEMVPRPMLGRAEPPELLASRLVHGPVLLGLVAEVGARGVTVTWVF